MKREKKLFLFCFFTKFSEYALGRFVVCAFLLAFLELKDFRNTLTNNHNVYNQSTYIATFLLPQNI